MRKPGDIPPGHFREPDPIADIKPKAACLPNDADDDSDEGQETTDHANEGWRAIRIAKP